MSAPPHASVAPAAGTAAESEPQPESAPRSEPRGEWLPPQSPAPQPSWVASEGRWVVRWVVVLFVLTAGLWGAGKVACNHHPLGSLNFKPVAFEARIDRPKNAALEFHHALNVGLLETARRLTAPEATAWLEAQVSSCDAACVQRQNAWRDAADTRAVLHYVRGSRAEVTAETHHAGSVIAARYLLSRDGKQWKVVRRVDAQAGAGGLSPSGP